MEAGRVRVNEQLANTPGTLVDPSVDSVTVDGQTIRMTKAAVTIMLNKPRGLICSTNEKQGETVFSLIKDLPYRLFMVGRLDRQSEGLLILTNDGALAQELTHPSFGHQKHYRVSVSPGVSTAILHKLNVPMKVDGEQFQAAEVRCLQRINQGVVLEFVLREGRNRQIRRMCEQVGLKVHRLQRTQIGALALGRLPIGQYRELSKQEIEQLRVGPETRTSPA